MKSFMILATVGILTFTSCGKNSSEGNKENVTNTSVVKEEHTSTEIPQNNGGGSLSSESSNLNSDQSNLNIDINLAADQLFDFDKSDLKPQAEAELSKAYEQFKNQPKADIEVIGYTDAKGSDSYNNDLSMKRAEAVRNWLVKNGCRNTIKVEGKGAENPIAPNKNADGSDNPDGRAKNRRVEIKVTGTKSL